MAAFHLLADPFAHTVHRFRSVRRRLAICFEHSHSHLLVRREGRDIADELRLVLDVRSESLGSYRHNHIQRRKAARKIHTKLAGVRMLVSGALHSEVAERRP